MSELASWEAVDPAGAACHEFRIVRTEARDVTGAIWLPEGERADALVCFGHGASGDRFQPPATRLARRLVGAGVPFLALEGPDHGLRHVGDGGRRGMVLDLARPGSIDEMARERNLAFDAVCAAFALDVARVGYVGLSMGTAYGLPFVASRTDVAAAVLGLWGEIEGMPQMEGIVTAARNVEAPSLFLMQADDEFVSDDAYLKLFEALGSPDKRLHANPISCKRNSNSIRRFDWDGSALV